MPSISADARRSLTVLHKNKPNDDKIDKLQPPDHGVLHRLVELRRVATRLGCVQPNRCHGISRARTGVGRIAAAPILLLLLLLRIF